MEQGYRKEIRRMGREPGAGIRRYELTDTALFCVAYWMQHNDRKSVAAVEGGCGTKKHSKWNRTLT